MSILQIWVTWVSFGLHSSFVASKLRETTPPVTSHAAALYMLSKFMLGDVRLCWHESVKHNASMIDFLRKLMKVFQKLGHEVILNFIMATISESQVTGSSSQVTTTCLTKLA